MSIVETVDSRRVSPDILTGASINENGAEPKGITPKPLTSFETRLLHWYLFYTEHLNFNPGESRVEGLEQRRNLMKVLDAVSRAEPISFPETRMSVFGNIKTEVLGEKNVPRKGRTVLLAIHNNEDNLKGMCWPSLVTYEVDKASVKKDPPIETKTIAESAKHQFSRYAEKLSRWTHGLSGTPVYYLGSQYHYSLPSFIRNPIDGKIQSFQEFAEGAGAQILTNLWATLGFIPTETGSAQIKGSINNGDNFLLFPTKKAEKSLHESSEEAARFVLMLLRSGYAAKAVGLWRDNNARRCFINFGDSIDLSDISTRDPYRNQKAAERIGIEIAKLVPPPYRGHYESYVKGPPKNYL